MKLIEGYHVTQAETRSIKQMIEWGYNTGTNSNKTKMYCVLKGCQVRPDVWQYDVEIKTRERTTIGANVTTTTRVIKVQMHKKPKQNQDQKLF